MNKFAVMPTDDGRFQIAKLYIKPDNGLPEYRVEDPTRYLTREEANQAIKELEEYNSGQ